jgi:hypothetical protein
MHGTSGNTMEGIDTEAQTTAAWPMLPGRRHILCLLSDQQIRIKGEIRLYR